MERYNYHTTCIWYNLMYLCFYVCILFRKDWTGAAAFIQISGLNIHYIHMICSACIFFSMYVVNPRGWWKCHLLYVIIKVSMSLSSPLSRHTHILEIKNNKCIIYSARRCIFYYSVLYRLSLVFSADFDTFYEKWGHTYFFSIVLNEGDSTR